MITDNYYHIKHNLSELENWKWMRDHQEKSKFNADVKTINDWLGKKYPDYTVKNTYDKNLTLLVNGDGVAKWQITDMFYNFTFRSYDGFSDPLEVNEITYYINKVLLSPLTKTPDYDKIIKDIRDNIKETISDTFTDFYLDMLGAGYWYNFEDRRLLWYKNKGYEIDKVTFTNFSESGKTCCITAYKDGEVLFTSKRYSLIVFSESNYHWLEGQLINHCRELDTKKIK